MLLLRKRTFSVLVAEKAGLAQEALAAVTSAENFAEINLKKVDRFSSTNFAFEPFKDLMLILIKGRRQPSLHLLNPIIDSINEGDCYLLISPLKVFAWIGRHANSIEKNKALDLIDYLKQHRDLGVRLETKFFILDQGKDDTENDIHAEFRDVLHSDAEIFRSVDDVIDDEYFEMNQNEVNRVYQVENDTLVPLEEYCFRPLSVKILDPQQVFVFDFASELYVWNGKYADKVQRQIGLQLAQQLWNDHFDFTDSLLNPFNPVEEENGQSIGECRPSWCLLGKQNQNVETLLFKSKFIDWPSDERKTIQTNRIGSSQRVNEKEKRKTY